MYLKTKFEDAVSRSRNLQQKPKNDELLKLYALYKQSTNGDVSGERPGGFDFKGAAKFDAWSELKGNDPQSSMQEYVELVDSLIEKYGG